MSSIELFFIVFTFCCVFQPHFTVVVKQFETSVERVRSEAVDVILVAVSVDPPDITSGTHRPARKPKPRCKKVSSNQKSTQLLLATLTLMSIPVVAVYVNYKSRRTGSVQKALTDATKQSDTLKLPKSLCRPKMVLQSSKWLQNGQKMHLGIHIKSTSYPMSECHRVKAAGDGSAPTTYLAHVSRSSEGGCLAGPLRQDDAHCWNEEVPEVPTENPQMAY